METTLDAEVAEALGNPKITKADLLALVRRLDEARKEAGPAFLAGMFAEAEFVDDEGKIPPVEMCQTLFQDTLADYTNLLVLFEHMVSVRTGETDPALVLQTLTEGGEVDPSVQALVDHLTPDSDEGPDDYQRLLLDYIRLLNTMNHPSVRELLTQLSQPAAEVPTETEPAAAPPAPPAAAETLATCPTCRGHKWLGTVVCSTCAGWGQVVVA